MIYYEVFQEKFPLKFKDQAKEKQKLNESVF